MASSDHSELFKRAHRLVDAAPEEQQEEWAKRGRAGTEAHAVGAAAFGPRAPATKRRRLSALGAFDELRADPALGAPIDALVMDG